MDKDKDNAIRNQKVFVSLESVLNLQAHYLDMKKDAALGPSTLSYVRGLKL